MYCDKNACNHLSIIKNGTKENEAKYYNIYHSYYWTMHAIQSLSNGSGTEFSNRYLVFEK